MSLKNLPNASDVASYLAAIEAHPFAALLLAVAVIAGILAWRRPDTK